MYLRRPPLARCAQVSPSSHPGCDAIVRHCDPGSKERIWYVFQPELVVPEYIVEYDYCGADDLGALDPAAAPPGAALPPGADVAAAPSSLFAALPHDVQPIMEPLRAFLDACSSGPRPGLEGGQAAVLQPVPFSVERQLAGALLLPPMVRARCDRQTQAGVCARYAYLF